jgi:hypothetical protein
MDTFGENKPLSKDRERNDSIKSFLRSNHWNWNYQPDSINNRYETSNNEFGSRINGAHLSLSAEVILDISIVLFQFVIGTK